MAEDVESSRTFGGLASSDPSMQEPDQTQHAETQSGPNTRPTCPSCGKTGIRKRYMQCAVCSRHWHMTCVRLSSAQANALHRWWCPECVNNGLDAEQDTDISTSHMPAPSSPLHPETGVADAGADLGLALAVLRRSRPVIRRIPKGARIAAAEALATLLEQAIDSAEAGPWSRLMRFPYEALSADSDATKSSLTTRIKQQITAYSEASSDSPTESSFRYMEALEATRTHAIKSQRKASTSAEKLKRNVGLKLSDGDVKGAIRLLSSADTVAQDSKKTIEALTAKHPPAPENVHLPPPPDETTRPFLASCADVEAAVKSFSPGSSAGLDGLRPSHLKDLIGFTCGEAGRRLVAALTSLVNLALLGEVPPAAREAFFTASLLALEKPCGGIRPIAIGSTYRRLATKVALRPLSSELGAKLRPAQLGFGTAGGCEAAVHAIRQFVNHMGDEDVVVKIDMHNAFNSIRRDHFLAVIREDAPSLYPLLWQAYATPTPLYHGCTKVMSATGVQQGDPSGPAVFALATHSIISSATCSMNTWFLDDGVLGGDIEDVCSDLEKLIPAMVKIGLQVNPSKCQIIAPVNGAESDSITRLHSIIPSASVLTEGQKMVLGAPLTAAATETTAKEKTEDLMRMTGRLRNLDAHTALYLLRNCLWMPKLQYLLRAAPFFQHPALLKHLDEIIRAAMEELINVRFSDANWKQAVLPTGLGGLGLRLTKDVALPSFIASLHRCCPLLHTILPDSLGEAVAKELKQAEDEWLEKTENKAPPEDDARTRQKSWDTPIAEQQKNRLLMEGNQFDRARILGAATSESGAWLRALPSASLGTHLDNETVRIAVALRIGADVCSGVHVCKCGSLADVKGHHVLTCRFSAGRIPRHTALNDIVRRALQSAGVPAQLEPSGLDRGDGKRPDGITIYPFSNGRCLIWDATCVNTFANSRLGDAALNAGTAAEKAEERKLSKYASLTTRFRFQPIAFESDGACGPSTRSFIRELGARISSVSGESRETEWLLQRLSIAVVRGNAASILLDRSTESYQPKRMHPNCQMIPPKTKPQGQSQRQPQQQAEHRPRQRLPSRHQHQEPVSVSFCSSYQNESSQRWRSSPLRRPPSPLRAMENESPSPPRRPNQPPRRRDHSPSEAKRVRLSHSSERGPDRPDKENSEQQLPSASSRRFYGESGSGRPAGQQMWPPPSSRKAGEGGEMLYDGKVQSAREMQLIPAVHSPDPDKHETDPLYVGLPNYGNSCYQNATLQSLMGLGPFLSEMMPLIADPVGDQCRTLRAVAKLMVLRQMALTKSVSSHFNELRGVFADIDPVFRGTQMQDANEFLLRLLDTIKDELDSQRPAANPVRDNFQYQTVERYTCTRCQETMLKRQENISWIVSVPRGRGSEPPTLQDALRLSMRPDRRELLCQHCRHTECRVTTKVSQLPRTLILQLNRYVFLGGESRKIRTKVGIPKFLSLNECVADDVTQPPEWKCTKPSLSRLSEFEKPERPPAPSPVPAAAPPSTARGAPSHGADPGRPAGSPEDENCELQEAIIRSLVEGEPADPTADQEYLSKSGVEDDQSLCSSDLAADDSYRLVGVVSHYGGATHSGHYVSDVYNVDCDRWFHYDDRRVSSVQEADVLGDGHQRNGYMFFYLQKDLCSQVVSADYASGAP